MNITEQIMFELRAKREGWGLEVPPDRDVELNGQRWWVVQGCWQLGLLGRGGDVLRPIPEWMTARQSGRAAL